MSKYLKGIAISLITAVCFSACNETDSSSDVIEAAATTTTQVTTIVTTSVPDETEISTTTTEVTTVPEVTTAATTTTKPVTTAAATTTTKPITTTKPTVSSTADTGEFDLDTLVDVHDKILKPYAESLGYKASGVGLTIYSDHTAFGVQFDNATTTIIVDILKSRYEYKVLVNTYDSNGSRVDVWEVTCLSTQEVLDILAAQA